MNFPYYLHKILTKLSKFYQRSAKNLNYNLFHYGLINILVEYRLTQLGDSWDVFLCQNNFVKSLESCQEKITPQAGKIDEGF